MSNRASLGPAAPSEAAWAATDTDKTADAAMVEQLSQEYEKRVADLRRVFLSGRSKALSWRRQQLRQVVAMIEENHDAITAAVMADLGGNKLRGLAEMSAAGDAGHALDQLDSWASEKWVSGWLSRECIRPEPKGVTLNIAPWNFPFSMCLQPLVPAIAAGNCMIIKPSEVAPKCAAVIKQLVEKYLDTECIQVILGEVPHTSALLQQRFDHIFYTGNGAVGRIVLQAAAKHLTPVTLELGGKSPVIIDETADMAAAVGRISMAKWMNCGQICVAPDYVLVHKSKAEDFIEKMAAQVKVSFGENPADSPDYGNIIAERHVDRVRKLIETSGGSVVCGGVDGIVRDKKHIPPTIIKEPKLDAAIMHEEIFGPALPIIAFDNLDAALDIVNSKETPLALYVYSQSAGNIERVLRTASSGGTAVNSSLEQLMGNSMPFGGKGSSGMGSYHGRFGFETFSHMRAVLYKTTLPFMKGPAIPLPDAKNPLPGFVYGLAVRFTVIGLVPKCLSPLRKYATRLALVAACGALVWTCSPTGSALLRSDL